MSVAGARSSNQAEYVLRRSMRLGPPGAMTAGALSRAAGTPAGSSSKYRAAAGEAWLTRARARATCGQLAGHEEDRTLFDSATLLGQALDALEAGRADEAAA